MKHFWDALAQMTLCREGLCCTDDTLQRGIVLQRLLCADVSPSLPS